jgi:trehalose 6-phosphate phosphatase
MERIVKSPWSAIQELADLSPVEGRAGEELAIFLDIDGTLIEFAETPDQVTVAPELIDLLDRLADVTSGGVALVSGRSLDDIERLFPGVSLPAAGQHGAELRGTDSRPVAGRAEDISQLRADADRASRSHPRLLFEDKGHSVAIHYRRVPALAPIARWLALRFAARTAGRYVVQHGHYVEEIKPASASKGRAIEALAMAPGFAGRIPVFIGDDVTDEDGFHVVNGMGGVSIKVGSGPSVARWRLRNPQAVVSWLRRFAESLAVSPNPDRSKP